jgi:hypothetical protein
MMLIDSTKEVVSLMMMIFGFLKRILSSAIFFVIDGLSWLASKFRRVYNP